MLLERLSQGVHDARMTDEAIGCRSLNVPGTHAATMSKPRRATPYHSMQPNVGYDAEAHPIKGGASSMSASSFFGTQDEQCAR